jgi:hypothetical protein
MDSTRRSHQNERKKASGLYKRNYCEKIEENGVLLSVDPRETETAPEEDDDVEEETISIGISNYL